MGVVKKILEKYTKDELVKIASESINKSDYARKLGYTGNSYTQLNRIANAALACIPEFDTSNWLGHGSSLNKFDMTRFKNPSSAKSKNLKKALIYLRGHRCERCGLKKWGNEKITLEIHHIDGDRKNNTLENLKLLCPNCHSLTPNWRNRSGSVKKKFTDREIAEVIKESENIHQVINKLNLAVSDTMYERIQKIMLKDNLEFCSKKQTRCRKKKESVEKKVSSINKCPKCGGWKSRLAVMCIKCHKEEKRRRKEQKIGGKEKLVEIMEKYNYNASEVSRFYGVSDKCIKKWCVQYDIPCGKHNFGKNYENISKYSFEEIKDIYEKTYNIAETCRRIGSSPARLKTIFKRNNYDYKNKT